MTAYPAVEELLPHAPPMVLLDRVLDFDGDEARCEVEITPRFLFVEEGRARAVVSLELMAQCVGVCTSLRALARREPLAEGYLVGAREMSFSTELLEVGDVLEVVARLIFDGDELGSFQCRVEREGREIATGVLNVFRRPRRGGDR